MGKKNNLGRAIIKDRFKTGRKKGGGSYVSDKSHCRMLLALKCGRAYAEALLWMKSFYSVDEMPKNIGLTDTLTQLISLSKCELLNFRT